MADAKNGGTLRLNLDAAKFLNGAQLPRVLTVNAAGRLTTDESTPATNFDLDETIVFPALVNSHDHLEFSLYPALGDPPYQDVDEWARDVHENYAPIVSSIEGISPELRRYWGLLKNLTCGVTTVMDHGTSYDFASYDLPVRIIKPHRHVHRADTRWAWLHARRSRGDGPLVFHLAEGTSRKVERRSARFLRHLNGHGPYIGVHGIKLDSELARHLDALVWCPVSNLFLFNQTTDVAALKGATEILFGTDASISAEGTIWDHLRIARASGGLSDAELLDTVTTTAMRVWGLEDTGDMVIARRRHADPWESFFKINAADICAVISQQQLVLMGEDFYQDIALDTWNDTYKAIEAGGVSQRIFCPSSEMLASLASIDGSPLSLK